MIRYISYKFRIKPTKTQESLFIEHCDASRFIYNKLLEQQISLYENEKKFMFGMALSNAVKPIKENNDWLKKVNSQSLQQSALNLGKAFSNKFKHKTGGFPKFKSRKSSKQAFSVPQHFNIRGNKVKLPKIGWIKIVNHRKLSGKAKSLVISLDVDQWFVSILCEQDVPVPTIDYKSVVGIDLGIKTFAITSDGEVFELPKLEQETTKLKKLQRSFTRKQKGSNNRNKARIKVAKQYRKISRIKDDLINNYVSSIAKSYDVVSMENLNIQGMKKNHCLAPSIQQLPWFSFKMKLKHKVKELVEVGRFYPSSKTCSACGFVKKDLSLSERTYHCENCGLSIDRDLNAAINIKDAATALFACGGTRVPVKQESGLIGDLKLESL